MENGRATANRNSNVWAHGRYRNRFCRMKVMEVDFARIKVPAHSVVFTSLSLDVPLYLSVFKTVSK